MSYTERFTEKNRPLAKIDPASYAAEQNTSRVSLANYHRAVIIIGVGDIAAGRTLDVDVEQHTASSGGTTKNVTGKSITQLTDTDDNKIVAIELKTEELDVDGGFEHISVELTPSAGIILYCLVFGIEPRFAPAGTTEWDEVVD